MRNTIKISFIFLLTLIIASCSQDDAVTENQAEIADKQMIELLNSKLGVETTIEKGNYKFTYPDGPYLLANTLGENITVSGTRINNKTFIFEKLNQNEIIDTTNPYVFLNTVNKQDFISTVNNLSNLEIGLYARPCDEHPSNEEFDDCFEREWDEFCDGFVGCVAQATNPVLIAAVIAGHCAAC